MFVRMSLLSLLTVMSLQSVASEVYEGQQFKSLKIQAPDKIRDLAVPNSDIGLSLKQIREKYKFTNLGADKRSSIPLLVNLSTSGEELSPLVAQEKLQKLYASEFDIMLSRMVLVIVETMEIKNIHLKSQDNKPSIEYTTVVDDSYGWTTQGLDTDCWDCGVGGGNREKIATALGVDSGSLYEKISQNPRFVPGHLFRSSGTDVRLTFDTIEQGKIKIIINTNLRESYQAFVADISASEQNPSFSTRVMGLSQDFGVLGYIEDNSRWLDENDKKLLGTLFYTLDSYALPSISGAHSMNIAVKNSDAAITSIYKNVVVNAVPGNKDLRPSVKNYMQGISQFINLTNTYIDPVPKSSPSLFQIIKQAASNTVR